MMIITTHVRVSSNVRLSVRVKLLVSCVPFITEASPSKSNSEVAGELAFAGGYC